MASSVLSATEVAAVVQDKFLSNERVTSVACDCRVVGEDSETRDRILCVVEHASEKALVSMLTSNRPPATFSDLAIERVFPIDDLFKCDIENEQSSNEILLRLIVTCRRVRVEFEMEVKTSVDGFVDDIYSAIKEAGERSDHDFEWLRKYSGKLEDSPQIVVPRHSLACGSPLARESRIRYEMLLKEGEFTIKKQFTVLTATWNVNDKSPTVPLEEWLCDDEQPPDIYAIGFQELDLSKDMFLYDQTRREEEWSDAIIRCLQNRSTSYDLVERVRLVGMMLLVLIAKRHSAYVRSVASDTVGTGIMGKMGNKGGVAVRFDLHNTSVCFVNSHLAAHTEEFERRNQDYRDICSRTMFHLPGQPPRAIKDHDQIYWLGDLNYRITGCDIQVVKSRLSQGKLEDVLQYDQLRRQRMVNAVFVGYEEGPITFQPTYKYDSGTDNWDSSDKSRTPAWCDRVLWRGENIRQIYYKSHPSLKISDHKPVSALFETLIKVVEEEKHRKVYEDVIKKLDKWENELIPQVMVDRTELEFGSVRYLEPEIRSLTVANTGQVPAQFEFIRKLDETSFCKDWLLVEPCAGCITPGDKCDIQLKIFINKNSACKMNAGLDRISDILVLHLEGGKDIFITVSGSYECSCFGSSIEALVQMRVPIRELPPHAVAELERRRFSPVKNQAAYLIPKEIFFLVDHIYRHGMREPNLFEQPGLHSEIVQIRDWLDEGSDSSNLPGSVHSVAEALLLLLESTAEPLVPYNLHSVCLSASANYLQCKQIVVELPEFRLHVFLYLCEFLQEVLRNSSDNGLDAKTLSTLFGSIFLRDTPNQSEHRNRYTKQAVDKKKANFVYHFLVNPLCYPNV